MSAAARSKGRRGQQELPPGKALREEWMPDCGVMCEVAEQEYSA